MLHQQPHYLKRLAALETGITATPGYEILQEGFNQKIGAFTQLLGGNELDATALTIPLLGLLPATDERVKSTITQIKEKVSANGLVYRYLTDDGLPGREATSGICSFWLVDNLALAGWNKAVGFRAPRNN